MALSRRQFVKHSAVAATTLSLPMVASSRVLGANDEIRVGIIGVGGRGGGCHLPIFLKQPGVRVAAICDPRDYDDVLWHLTHDGEIPVAVRFEFAKKAFGHTAAYDAAIFGTLPDFELETGRRRGDAR